MAQSEMTSGNVMRRPYDATGGVDRVDVNTAVVTPVDRVRWAAILAGLFTAISILLTLTVLGLAIGLASWDPNTPASAIGIGAGVWGLVTSLIAFGIGGFVAGRTSALPGRDTGFVNGGMVWTVAIPLLIWLLGSGVGTLLNVASNVADAGVAAIVDSPGAVATAIAPATDGTGDAGVAGDTGATGGAAQVNPANPVTAQEADQAANNASSTAWGTLLWMGLGFAAAALGGAAGARTPTYAEARTNITHNP
ncbi:MAG: hypothetical protein IT323_11850 [Anaerolineae bacterium]|nr:hypothetical protein [Anaerolineae bacterium]